MREISFKNEIVRACTRNETKYHFYRWLPKREHSIGCVPFFIAAVDENCKFGDAGGRGGRACSCGGSARRAGVGAALCAPDGRGSGCAPCVPVAGGGAGCAPCVFVAGGGGRKRARKALKKSVCKGRGLARAIWKKIERSRFFLKIHIRFLYFHLNKRRAEAPQRAFFFEIFDKIL